MQKGSTLIFLPCLPGIYTCLSLSEGGNMPDSDLRSVLSSFSNTQSLGKHHKISKELMKFNFILDLNSLDRKSQQILRYALILS